MKGPVAARVEWLRSYLVPRFALVVWAVSLSVLVSSFMVAHWVALPTPAIDDPALSSQVRSLAGEERSEWVLLHVLYSRCRCSQKLFDYLFARKRPENTRDRLLLVQPDEWVAWRARAAGFEVEQVTPEELRRRFNVQSAPLLVVADPAGKVHYAGGYTGRKQGLDYQDTRVLADLRAGKSTGSLPLFGCGVSQELQAYLDPMGLKYGEDK